MKKIVSLVFALCLAAGPALAENDCAVAQDETEITAVEGNGTAEDSVSVDTVNEEETAERHKERDILAMRRAVNEAHELFEQAMRSCDNGNLAKAKELYVKSLSALLTADIDMPTFYKLKGEFNGLFSKLDLLLRDETHNTAQRENGFTIAMDRDNAMVKKYLALYTQGRAKETIRGALERSGRYRDMILPVLKEYDLPEELFFLPVVESLFTINDLSHAGALGLWQIMPDRARALGLKVNYWIDERRDPEKSTRAAAQYLRELYLMFDNWHLALAAYNRGEFGLARDLKFSNATNIEEISDRNAVPGETERYVPQFIACALIGSNPKQYGFNDLTFAQPVVCDRVTIQNVIDLKIVAECAGTTVDVIRGLNPALKAWCTPHNYPDFELKLPAGSKESFVAAIAQVKDLNPSRGFIKYRVVRGDCLSKIAKKFATTSQAIKEDNRIKNVKSLRIGQTLVIRPGRKYFK